MELWSRLCLLVLAATASTRGQDTLDEKEEGLTNNTTLTSEAKSSNISSNISSTTSSNVFSTTATVPPEVQTSTTNKNDTATISPKSGNASSSITTVTVTTVTDATTVTPVGHWGSTTGYVVLALIILVIIVLCIILFCLRRASRTYSFDLQRPAPPNHVHLPTFEPIDLDDFGTFSVFFPPIRSRFPLQIKQTELCFDSSEQTTPKALQMTENLHPPPPSSSSAIPNGTSQRSEGEGSSDESHTSLEEQLAANVTEVLPNENVPPTSDNPTELQPDQWSCTDLFFDADNGEKNQKTPFCSSEPFVEVNLEEDAW
ncbi:uncharacterized protein LOC114480496 isoform X2 [Gouania willdenowi]|uniref:uncharacterized protein LOC114480496 isoform X2 n=1 Tax=Gouania willdenowi TaxID=441366 RepID=UPI001055225C|nr:uncharacterized protein LOC114480496 isoform X2 [Gouania willdenowi]